MNKQEIVKNSVRGVIIVFMATGMQYIVAFVTQIFLARLLAPSQFGILAFTSMVAMFFYNVVRLADKK